MILQPLRKLETNLADVVEPNVTPIRLKTYLTRNFGFNLKNSTNSLRLVKFIEQEFEMTFQEEIKINRNPRFDDNRIHVGLYFIRPTGKRYVYVTNIASKIFTNNCKSLNEFDIDSMKKLASRINLIPIIAKSDSLTDEEMQLNKRLILESIREHEIPIFNFLDEFVDDEYDYLRTLQDKLPFSVISANSGQKRKTLWGEIDVMDASICDFLILKNILFGSHIHEFKEITVNKKYENYRIQKLLNSNINEPKTPSSLNIK